VFANSRCLQTARFLSKCLLVKKRCALQTKIVFKRQVMENMKLEVKGKLLNGYKWGYIINISYHLKKSQQMFYS
jgi:hypothetical protein